MSTECMPIGIVKCTMLFVYFEPATNSEIICDVKYSNEVLIDIENSTDKFYKICTEIGAEGYCKKDFIEIIY